MAGSLPHVRRRISDAFRGRVREYMRDREPGHVLATRLGLNHPSGLSELLHREIPTTPLVVSRLKNLASIVDFDGEMFEPERDVVTK